MATAHEDFTFPTFPTDPFSSGIDSPPLWRLSPSASPIHNSCHFVETTTEQEQEQEQDSDDHEEFQDCFPLHNKPERKSFSWIEKGYDSKLQDKEDDEEEEEEEEEEEKMDMLWEDFNEELPISCHTSRFDYGSDHHMIISNRGSSCVQSLRLNKKTSNSSNTAMVSPKKPPSAAGFVVFIKVLKKLFLHHHHHHHHHHPHHHMSVQTHRSCTRAKNRSW